MRANDPFDVKAEDVATNPNGYTFDPAYIYSSFQGINTFVGISWKIK